MKSIILFLLWGWLCCPVNASFYFSTTAVGGGGGSYNVQADFEGAGDTAITETSGSPNNSYATAPAPLVGSFSCAVSAPFDYNRWLLGGADKTEQWFFFHTHVTASGTNSIFELQTLGNVTQAGIQIRSDRVNLVHGSVTNSYMTAMQTGDSVVWVRYVAETVAGSSNDGIFTLYYNKNSSSETRAAAVLSLTTGNGDAVRKARFVNANDSAVRIIDKLRASDTEIFSNPT